MTKIDIAERATLPTESGDASLVNYDVASDGLTEADRAVLFECSRPLPEDSQFTDADTLYLARRIAKAALVRAARRS